MLPLGVSFWDGCFFSAAARRAWGVSVVQTRGEVQPGGRGKEGVQRSLSREGALYSALSSSAGEGPPLVQHRPRVTYSGTAKGPLLGGLPIVSGLEGVCVMWKRRREGLNPAACY